MFFFVLGFFTCLVLCECGKELFIHFCPLCLWKVYLRVQHRVWWCYMKRKLKRDFC